ncbi:Lrp/AsnC family transcriptional regulator [Kordiimonas sp. SCSIO 12610]|uniref:Lrp/AsnC family transcriptional regulator n=1 Tax=Kordiimonas sp. SCSIO 12610 TaxID=2829597 RepID=UPI00210CEE53|nr:Lrp/AsnC family transcriptional regulator [Kordiimonas sp. SCSIO 12610]UTW55925.1 Lrp/AsnC family transcriptional regulator [Kordiimonas sp. SCSIO 12610]
MIDELDAKILNKLQNNATMSLQDLGGELASSRSAVWRRIQRMEELGIIKQHTVLLDPEKVGLGVMVFAQVKMQAHGQSDLPNFIEQVQRFPEVIECHTLMGDVDFILKIRVPDIQSYEKLFWDHLSRIDGVREINSSIALTAVKDTTVLNVQPVTMK